MTLALCGDHGLPSLTWPDRDSTRLPGGPRTLKATDASPACMDVVQIGVPLAG